MTMDSEHTKNVKQWLLQAKVWSTNERTSQNETKQGKKKKKVKKLG